MSNLNQRLAKIEHDRQTTGVAVVWMRPSENTDTAIARYMAEHEKPDPRTDAALTVYLIKWASESEGAAA